jgi:hypothetical protein
VLGARASHPRSARSFSGPFCLPSRIIQCSRCSTLRSPAWARSSTQHPSRYASASCHFRWLPLTHRQLGGLGLSPAAIGLFLGIFGVLNGTFQLLFFPAIVARLGPRGTLATAMSAFVPIFAWFPAANALARARAPLLPILGVQIVLMSTMYMAYAATFMYITSSAPGRVRIFSPPPSSSPRFRHLQPFSPLPPPPLHALRAFSHLRTSYTPADRTPARSARSAPSTASRRPSSPSYARSGLPRRRPSLRTSTSTAYLAGIQYTSRSSRSRSRCSCSSACYPRDHEQRARCEEW